jgi:hypothetical protein
MPKHDQSIAGLAALARLIEIAQRDTGQSRRVADFLLAWHNAAENGGWDITDLWNVDQSIGDDMFTVLHLIRAEQRYPDDQGFKDEMQCAAYRDCAKGHRPITSGRRLFIGLA